MKGRIGLAAKLLVSALLIWFLFSRRELSLESLADSLAAPRWGWLLAAVGVFALSALGGAVQWGWLLRAAGLRTPRTEILRVYLVGLFFNNFLPGNVGGDAVKVFDLGRREGRTAAVFGGTVLDRLLGLFALTLLALGAVVLAGVLETRLPPVLPLALAALVWVGILALLLSRRVSDRALTLLDRLPWPAVAVRFRSVLVEFRTFRLQSGLLLRVLLWALLVQGLRVATHVLVAAGLGLALGDGRILQLFVLVPMLGILISLPISFNGLGLREVAAADLFVAVGVVALSADAVAVEFLAYVVQVLVSLVGGVLFLVGARSRRAS